MTSFKDKFPDPAERERFAMLVVQDYQEHSYHAFAHMYILLGRITYG